MPTPYGEGYKKPEDIVEKSSDLQCVSSSLLIFPYFIRIIFFVMQDIYRAISRNLQRKNIMKRITALVITLIFVLGVAGCESMKTTSGGNGSSASVASNDITRSKENESTEKKESNPPTTQETNAPADKMENTGTAKPTESKDTDISVTAKPTEEKNDTPSSMELKKVGVLQYYLYTPSNPTNGMPLIVYLHGGTNKKADVSALLTTDGFPKYLYDGYYGNLRAYVVIPKLDNQYKGWADISDRIKDLIKIVHTNYHIDKSRVSLTGHSMGGTGTYQLQIKLPDTFACIAPASGSVPNNEANLTALSKTKIWAFVGTEDTVVSPDSSRIIIQALNEKGANVKITEFSGATHFDVPSLAYKNSALIDWLVHCGV